MITEEEIKSANNRLLIQLNKSVYPIETAEDITQEILLKAYVTYNEAKGLTFEQWCFAILVSVKCDYFRKHGDKFQDSNAYKDIEEPDRMDPLEYEEFIDKCYAEITDEIEKKFFILFFIQQKKRGDINKQLSLAEGEGNNIYKKLLRKIQRVAEELEICPKKGGEK